MDAADAAASAALDAHGRHADAQEPLGSSGLGRADDEIALHIAGAFRARGPEVLELEGVGAGRGLEFLHQQGAAVAVPPARALESAGPYPADVVRQAAEGFFGIPLAEIGVKKTTDDIH